MSRNLDEKTVEGFGHEWAEFDQSRVSAGELQRIFDRYFELVDWAILSPKANVFDLGCGSGRWARYVAPRVGTLHCLDPSRRALEVAKHNLREASNCRFYEATIETAGLPAESMDFGYSLGVLDHVPDSSSALKACFDVLKPGGSLLLYMFYAFDDKPRWFRGIWRLSDLVRQFVSRLPHRMKVLITTGITVAVYLPLASISRFLEARGRPVDNIPLSLYRDKSFMTMRTDAYDRFATRLEHRYTRAELTTLVTSAGFSDIKFADGPPFWRMICTKRSDSP